MERQQLPKCDLVMQGGITSGVVYPGAILELKDHYQFESIGGASAGAIAAVAAAAAEYGAKHGALGFARLQTAIDELCEQPGLLLSLFQPSLMARAPFDILRQVAKPGSLPLKALRAIGALLMTWWFLVLAIVLALVIFEPDAFGSRPKYHTLGIALAAWLLALVAATVTIEILMLRQALREQNFGLCWGKRSQPPAAIAWIWTNLLGQTFRPALIEWLHEQIQECAFEGTSAPLTFAMLEDCNVHLRLISTDLSYGRPVALPLPDDETNPYYFKQVDLMKILPGDLVTHLMENSTLVEGSDVLRHMPGTAMPVAVAARLSLSFPFLLSAHERPTEAERTELTASGQAPRWIEPGGIITFVMQMFDAARNWRDTLQAEMPSAWGRVCRIYLDANEGGLNLDMQTSTINTLKTRGHNAGVRLSTEFDWPRHRFYRFKALMHLLQTNFSQMAPSYATFSPVLVPGVPGFDYGALDLDWRMEASAATEALLAASEGLGAPGGPNFDEPGFLPAPIPAMRAVPDV